MTPEELPAFLRSLQGRTASAAAPAANEMASTVARESRRNLNLVSHAPGIYWKAPADRPPARATGHLLASMVVIPGFQRVRATSIVGNTAVYSAIQEFGGWTEPTRHVFMHWLNDQGSWYLPHVDIPTHGYIRPAVERTIRDGSLQGSAIGAFMKSMSPLIR